MSLPETEASETHSTLHEKVVTVLQQNNRILWILCFKRGSVCLKMGLF